MTRGNQDRQGAGDYDSLMLSVVMAHQHMLAERIQERQVRERMARVEERIKASGWTGYVADAVRRSARARAERRDSHSLNELLGEMISYIGEREAAGEDAGAVMTELMDAGQSWALR